MESTRLLLNLASIADDLYCTVSGDPSSHYLSSAVDLALDVELGIARIGYTCVRLHSLDKRHWSCLGVSCAHRGGCGLGNPAQQRYG